jgi:two-component system, chemotaxis family, sensor kinase CheA
MTSKDQELLQKLLATFKIEAEDHLRSISSGLTKLEKASSAEEQLATIEQMFREAHSLKGAARAVNRENVEATCQRLETLLARLKLKELSVSRDLIEELYRIVDNLNATLLPGAPVPSTGREPVPQVQEMHPLSDAASVHDLSATKVPPVREAAATDSATDSLSAETLRVSALKLDAFFRQTEELIPARTIMRQRVAECRELQEVVHRWAREWRSAAPLNSLQYARDGARSSDTLRRALDLNQKTLESLQTKLAVLGKHLSQDGRWLDRRIDDLVEEAKRISMVPISTLLEPFPKLVRDLCRDCGKEAELVMTGVDIEADRRVLEQMKDPLIHLVRNSIDHGIEPPDVRLGLGKPARATISIAVSPKDGDKVEINVSDDGAGIDVDKVRNVAVKLGRLIPEEARRLEAGQALSLIFESGVSTSAMITEVSGRGLGLAIVREKVEKVGGTVTVETSPGVETNFRLIVPLTFARFRGIVVRISDYSFVLPTTQVQRVVRVSQSEIKSVENRDTIQFNDRVVSAVRLADVLGMLQKNLPLDLKRKIPAVILGWAGEQIAFLVDEVIDEQEVLVRNLGRQLPNVRNIAGATILGTGKVLPVLNVADLIQSAANLSSVSAQEVDEKPKHVLVAEDSITARSLLKNILETAGYNVKTAVDGADALALLENEDFDLVVSDVDMPRLNGFDLTAKIRRHRKLLNLPVVLVTALDSRVDRERGADVGANVYIVKGGFDQSNLLDVVKRLV